MRISEKLNHFFIIHSYKMSADSFFLKMSRIFCVFEWKDLVLNCLFILALIIIILVINIFPLIIDSEQPWENLEKPKL